MGNRIKTFSENNELIAIILKLNYIISTNGKIRKKSRLINKYYIYIELTTDILFFWKFPNLFILFNIFQNAIRAEIIYLK